MPSGHLRTTLRSENSLTKMQREYFEEDNIYRSLFKKNLFTWPAFIEIAAMKSGPFHVTILGMKDQDMTLDNAQGKDNVVQQLVRLDDTVFESSAGSKGILDTRWGPASYNPARDLLPIISLASKEIANSILHTGLLWGQGHHDCEMYGAEKLPGRCPKCMRYGHTFSQCSDEYHCMRCGLRHHVRLCTSTNEACAVCTGSHPTESDECFVRQAVKSKIERMQFPVFDFEPSNLETSLQNDATRPAPLPDSSRSQTKVKQRTPPPRTKPSVSAKPHSAPHLPNTVSQKVETNTSSPPQQRTTKAIVACPRISHSLPTDSEAWNDSCIRERDFPTDSNSNNILHKLKNLQSNLQKHKQSLTPSMKNYSELTKQSDHLEARIKALQESTSDNARVGEASEGKRTKRKIEQAFMSGALGPENGSKKVKTG